MSNHNFIDSNDLPDTLSLGKTVGYESQYNASLLEGVPRQLSRSTLGLADDALPFAGVDIWNGYEVSWLTPKGKPVVAIIVCRVPISSPNLIESKSFKLYLNSFNQTQFESTDKVERILVDDLSHCAGAPVEVEVHTSESFSQLTFGELPGTNIDGLDIDVSQYEPDKNLLQIESSDEVEETLNSHLLKSNCLITNQPDWASVCIRYTGSKISQKNLLQYLISFRQHNEFHEQCVERIYCDLMEMCQPRKLTVYARYTRRGGLDINPFRSNFENCYTNERLARQ